MTTENILDFRNKTTIEKPKTLYQTYTITFKSPDLQPVIMVGVLSILPGFVAILQGDKVKMDVMGLFPDDMVLSAISSGPVNSTFDA